VELQGIATRAQVNYLASKTSSAVEKEKLLHLAAVTTEPSNSPSYEEYIFKQKRTLLELIAEFKSLSITFGEFLGLVQVIRPRYYSISSSHTAFPNTAHITVGVVQGPAPTGRYHRGVASTYLAGLKEGDEPLVLVKNSSFKLPEDPSQPVIMVGPGTGVAPMRGFIQERKATKATGETVLFYGCRDDSDYIYRQELESYLAERTLLLLDVAYSRKQANKVYVQNRIVENGARVCELIQKGAYIYVCGDAKSMAPAVHLAFAQILESYGNLSPTLAQEYLASMSHTSHYLEDVWAGM